MAQAVIAQKAESIRRCIQRIEDTCPASAQALAADLDAQDILSLNLSRAIQLCVDIALHWLAENSAGNAPQTMGQSFVSLVQARQIPEDLGLKLQSAVGFRNIVIHQYEAVNWEIVFHLCTKNLDDFRQFVAAMLDD